MDLDTRTEKRFLFTLGYRLLQSGLHFLECKYSTLTDSLLLFIFLTSWPENEKLIDEWQTLISFIGLGEKRLTVNHLHVLCRSVSVIFGPVDLIIEEGSFDPVPVIIPDISTFPGKLNFLQVM